MVVAPRHGPHLHHTSPRKRPSPAQRLGSLAEATATTTDGGEEDDDLSASRDTCGSDGDSACSREAHPRAVQQQQGPRVQGGHHAPTSQLQALALPHHAKQPLPGHVAGAGPAMAVASAGGPADRSAMVRHHRPAAEGAGHAAAGQDHHVQRDHGHGHERAPAPQRQRQQQQQQQDWLVSGLLKQVRLIAFRSRGAQEGGDKGGDGKEVRSTSWAGAPRSATRGVRLPRKHMCVRASSTDLCLLPLHPLATTLSPGSTRRSSRSSTARA
jgi:hypothetical protein